MTKRRQPVTIENTLMRVLGQVTIERAAEATGRSADYLRALTDPDKREVLSVRDLLVLDLEARALGEPGFPLFTTLGLMLDAAGAERFAAAAEIGRHAIDVAKEHGEASAALVAAALSDGNPEMLRVALREMEDAHRADTAAIATLRAHLDAPAALRPEPPP